METRQTLETEIAVNFKCKKCGRTTQRSISNAILHGLPICTECDVEMKLVNADVSSQIVFANPEGN